MREFMERFSYFATDFHPFIVPTQPNVLIFYSFLSHTSYLLYTIHNVYI
jgi:hypothetical protein